ncbi:MAG: hypothetical protein WAV76_13155 [Bacteroidota bacterium]
MGTSSLLDIIGSFIIGGLILLLTRGMQLGAVENQFVYNSSVNLQINLVTLTTRMEDDFRKIAYCQNSEISPPSNAVLYADTSRFRFEGDFNNDGSIDSMEYLLGPPDVNSGNPLIRTVVRNYWPKGSALITDSIRLGVTQFNFQYKTQNTDSTILATPVNLSKYAVGMIEVTITLQSNSRIIDTAHSFVQDTALYKVYWRQFRIVGKNLTYR